MTSPDWHYPRKAFAEEVYDLLVKTPARSATLFGPRRTGKTQFVLNDLTPLAESRGHRVVYASFWQTPDAPLAVLLYAFDQALRGGRLGDRLASLAGRLVPKGKITVPEVGEIALEWTETKSAGPDGRLLHVDRFCERFADPKKPAFLLLDEFQALETAPGGPHLIAALRTSLDRRRDGLVSLFTGSSQAGLHRVFSTRDAPFFRFATPLALPRLGTDFVDHQLGVAKRTSKRAIGRKAALDIFARVDASPLVFQRWVQTLITEPSLEPDAALRAALDGLGGQAGFQTRWQKLSVRQRAVARLLAEGEAAIFSEAAAERIGALAGIPPPRTSQVQTDLRRLKRLDLAEAEGRTWSLSDPVFRVWARNTSEIDK